MKAVLLICIATTFMLTAYCFGLHFSRHEYGWTFFQLIMISINAANFCFVWIKG
jgi:hypothetical protein